jgi:hypothetical protein
VGNPAKGWNSERRKKQSEAIKRWKPWNQSTGPKSPEGRALVSRNAYSGGELVNLRAMVKALNQAMRRQKALLK